MLVQWFSPKSIAWLALTILNKYLWNKFLGEMLRTLAGTPGGATYLASSVNTLGSCVKFWDSMMLAGDDGLLWVCNMVGWLCLTGDVITGWTIASGCLFSAAFGAVVVAWTGGLLIFFVNMAANFLRAVIVPSSICGKSHIWMGVFQRTSRVLGCH